MINFHNKKMNVIKTAENGVVNHNTIFHFEQKGARVIARYNGGKVKRGVLVGNIKGRKLLFSYTQQHDDGQVAGGESKCDIKFLENGSLRLIERFNWEQGRGENVFAEVD